MLRSMADITGDKLDDTVYRTTLFNSASNIIILSVEGLAQGREQYLVSVLFL